MFGVGGSELMVIVFVALLVFGPSRVPEIARTVKRGYQEWARLRNQVDSTISEIRHEIDLKAELEIDSPPRIRPAGGTAQQSRPASQGSRNPALAVPAQDDYLADAAAAEDPGADTAGPPAEGK